jgi:hypothetical protein
MDNSGRGHGCSADHARRITNIYSSSNDKTLNLVQIEGFLCGLDGGHSEP